MGGGNAGYAGTTRSRKFSSDHYPVIGVAGLERNVGNDVFVYSFYPKSGNTKEFFAGTLVYDSEDRLCVLDHESRRKVEIEDGFEVDLKIRGKGKLHMRHYLFRDSSD